MPCRVWRGWRWYLISLINFTLHIACCCYVGHENIFRYLVEHGANVNEADEEGETSLYQACEEGHEGIIEYLIEHGADGDVVEHGADVNKADKKGKTPLHKASEEGHEGIVEYLIEHGARE